MDGIGPTNQRMVFGDYVICFVYLKKNIIQIFGSMINLILILKSDACYDRLSMVFDLLEKPVSLVLKWT